MRAEDTPRNRPDTGRDSSTTIIITFSPEGIRNRHTTAVATQAVATARMLPTPFVVIPAYLRDV